MLFRSLARRQEQALGGVPPHHDGVRSLVADLHLHVSAAARIVGTDVEPDAIAEGLTSRPAAAWSDAELTHLREIGLELGHLLRSLAERAEEVRDQGDA